MHSPDAADPGALARALAAEGVTGRVEASGRLAILRPARGARIEPATRRRLVELARQHGFTNLAVELASDADLPGD